MKEAPNYDNLEYFISGCTSKGQKMSEIDKRSLRSDNIEKIHQETIDFHLLDQIENGVVSKSQ